jgi:putative RNA 2'-phosphotransferase
MLRHKADEFGLTLDSEGFTEVDSVWAHVNKRYPGQYSYNDLLKIVEGDETGKKRYEIRDGHIRALFGHSDVREVLYPSAEPPKSLYHGTTAEAVESIKKTGLKSLGRQYVHLGTNKERALTVAARHMGPSVLLRVRALEAYQAGIVFHHPEPERYLAKAIPPEFIDFGTNG